MGRKKREHVVFDQMERIRKRIPISKVNTEVRRKTADVRRTAGNGQNEQNKTKNEQRKEDHLE